MQTVETLNEGLKRAFTLTIPAGDIAAKVDAEVKRAAPEVRMPGFRPGKVPANLIKKMHGPALEREALNTAVQEGIQALIAEQALRPAMQPQVELDENYAPGMDVEIKVTLEVLPQVPAPAIDSIKLERLTVEAADEAIDAQLKRFAAQQKSFEPALEGHPAVEGDQVVIDFVGKTEDGVAFPGGSGTGMSVEIGSGQLIPGFEAQLEGATVGEERTLHVTFPASYGEKSLAGKPATFDVTVTAVNMPKDAAIDDDFAKGLGLESLEKLRDLFKSQVEQELNGLTRTHMKRKLLDQLAAGHDFPVPPSMVDAEFEQIWRQLEHESTHEADPAAAMAEMEKERADYVAIAERRVRLGLLLSEIGQQNGVEVSQAEMQRLVAQAAQQYDPKERQRFVEYVQQDPIAAAQLRAPLYEDKVVDFLFGTAEITDRSVTREELEAAIEEDDGFASGTHMHDHGDHDHDHHDHDGHDHHDHAHDHDDHAAAEATDAEPAKKPAAKRAKKTESVEEIGAEEAPELHDAPAPKKRAPKKKAEAEG